VRGLVATTDLDAGALVFRIPRDLFITPGKIVEREDSLELLLAARVAEEFRKGPRSLWRKYLQAVPTRDELAKFHPMFASNEDLTLFSDLPMARLIRSTRSRLREKWSQNKEGRPLQDGVSWPTDLEWLDFLHAFVIQLSHRIRVRIPDSPKSKESHETVALVPMADMANLVSDRDANIRWEYSEDDDAVVVRTIKPVKSGVELVQAVYHAEQRPKDNGLLAYQYGITIGNNHYAADPLAPDVCDGDSTVRPRPTVA